MLIEIPDEIIGLPEYGKQALVRDIAVMLYQQERISLAKAARFAAMNRLEFQALLAEKGIYLNYDLESDVQALKKLSEGA